MDPGGGGICKGVLQKYIQGDRINRYFSSGNLNPQLYLCEHGDEAYCKAHPGPSGEHEAVWNGKPVSQGGG